MLGLLSLHNTRWLPNQDDDRQNHENEEATHKGDSIRERLFTRRDLYFDFVFLMR
jgi:hypothetical protein